jgi:hypothetical protein
MLRFRGINKGDCYAVEFEKIINTLRKIIRSDGTGNEKLKRMWDFLEAVEKEENSKPSETGDGNKK